MASNNIVGLSLNDNYTVISSDKVLNKVDGGVSNLLDIIKTQVNISSSVPASVAKQVEVVVGIEGQKIDFTLASSEGKFEVSDGFLVEVYLSGSDGVLTRVYEQDVVDVVNDTTLSEGFSNYLVLKIDQE